MPETDPETNDGADDQSGNESSGAEASDTGAVVTPDSNVVADFEHDTDGDPNADHAAAHEEGDDGEVATTPRDEAHDVGSTAVSHGTTEAAEPSDGAAPEDEDAQPDNPKGTAAEADHAVEPAREDTPAAESAPEPPEPDPTEDPPAEAEPAHEDTAAEPAPPTEPTELVEGQQVDIDHSEPGRAEPADAEPAEAEPEIATPPVAAPTPEVTDSEPEAAAPAGAADTAEDDAEPRDATAPEDEDRTADTTTDPEPGADTTAEAAAASSEAAEGTAAEPGTEPDPEAAATDETDADADPAGEDAAEDSADTDSTRRESAEPAADAEPDTDGTSGSDGDDGGNGKGGNGGGNRANGDDDEEDPVDRELREILERGLQAERDREHRDSTTEAPRAPTLTHEAIGNLADPFSNRISVRIPPDMPIVTNEMTVDTDGLGKALNRAGLEGKMQVSFIPPEATALVDDLTVPTAPNVVVPRDALGEEEIYFLGYPSDRPDFPHTPEMAEFEDSVVMRIDRVKFERVVSRTMGESYTGVANAYQYAVADVMNELLKDAPTGVIRRTITRFQEEHRTLTHLPRAVNLRARQARLERQRRSRRRMVEVGSPW